MVQMMAPTVEVIMEALAQVKEVTITDAQVDQAAEVAQVVQGSIAMLMGNQLISLLVILCDYTPTPLTIN